MLTDELINYCLDIITNWGCRYTQASNKRWCQDKDDKAFDCSSLMITCLRHLGIKQADKMTYTGDMVTCKTDEQIERLTFDSKIVRPGDILVWHKNKNIGHTALYIGNGKIAEAKGTKWGLCISPYYSSNWQYILRVKETETKEVKTEMKTDNFRSLCKGDHGELVMILQAFLKGCVDNSIEVDGSYGSLTARAVEQMYINCGINPKSYIDGEGWKLIELTLNRC